LKAINVNREELKISGGVSDRCFITSFLASDLSAGSLGRPCFCNKIVVDFQAFYYIMQLDVSYYFQGGLLKMATLHMEVETARSTQNTMTNNQAQLTSMVQSMTSSVNGLQPAWLGNSATEFFGEYEQWRSTSAQLLEALNVMTTRLGNEITEWETMASKLA